MPYLMRCVYSLALRSSQRDDLAADQSTLKTRIIYMLFMYGRRVARSQHQLASRVPFRALCYWWCSIRSFSAPTHPLCACIFQDITFRRRASSAMHTRNTYKMQSQQIAQTAAHTLTPRTHIWCSVLGAYIRAYHRYRRHTFIYTMYK